MTTLEHAKRYVEKFGWSVVPIPKGQKYPTIEWKEYQKRLPTLGELQNWFKETNGIGIVTGQLSQLSVLDVDSKNNSLSLKSPVVVNTPKGRHFYFKYNEQLKNWVKPTGQDWDIRTEGGLCVSPPSIGYHWTNPYFCLDKLPQFPSRLIPTETTTKKGSPKESGWIAKALEEMRIGNIDATLVSVLGRLRHDGYSRSDARALLYLTAKEAGATEGHLDDKIEHIWNNYENKKPTVNGVSLSVDSFLEKESRVEWLVPQIFAKQSLGFIVGLPEALKTWCAMDLAVELSRGGKWLGDIQTNKAKVLFIDQERALPETQRRFKALLAEKGLTKEEIGATLYIDCSSHRKIDLDNSYQSFRNELQQIKPDVIIVDSLVTFHTKSENDRMEIQKVLDRIKSIREEFGCSTIFINHESKLAYQDAQENQEPSAGRMVGSIGVIAAADSIVSIKKINDTTSALHHTKNSLANQVDSFMFSITDTDKGIKLQAVRG